MTHSLPALTVTAAFEGVELSDRLRVASSSELSGMSSILLLLLRSALTFVFSSSRPLAISICTHFIKSAITSWLMR